MLRQDLIAVNLECENADQAIRVLAAKFVTAGVVKESFIDAVAEREKVYPTALPATVFPIAIPHTVSEHVVTPAVGVAVLKEPVAFSQMGSPEIILMPQILFMLAIKDPKEQLGLLRKIMKLIQNDELLIQVKNSQSEADIFNILSEKIN